MVEKSLLCYPQWEKDAAEFCLLHEKYHLGQTLPSTKNSYNSKSNSQDHHKLEEWVLQSRLQGMKNKQQAFDGDRSHPYLKTLDQLIVHLTYPQLFQDYRDALHTHFHYDNDWLRQRCLFRLKQRQCLHMGDRSHPRLVELDALRLTLTYPGYERDWEALKELHLQYSDDYIGNNVVARHIESLKHRQAHWDGSNTKLASWKKLNFLRSEVTYDGCDSNVIAALEAHLYPCAMMDGHVVEFGTALHILCTKQEVFRERDRSHPRLVALDSVVDLVTAGNNTASNLLVKDSKWIALVEQLEQVHVRYALDDWVGNAVFDHLLRSLKRYQRDHTTVSSRGAPATMVPVTPKKNVKRDTLGATVTSEKQQDVPLSPAFSFATDPTALNTTLSWDSDDSDQC